MVDKDLLSKTRANFARYEGTDSKGRTTFIEFELEADGWLKRFGVLGFPASRSESIGDNITEQLEAVIENGFSLVADEGTLPAKTNRKMLGFRDWLQSRG
jgi:hypothetical protein